MRGRPLCAVFLFLIALVSVFRIAGIPYPGTRVFGSDVLKSIEDSDGLTAFGTVTDKYVHDDGISYLISDAAIDMKGSILKAGSINLYFKNTDIFLEIDSKVKAYGKLSLYSHASNDGGFDAYDHYSGEDRYFRMKCVSAEMISCPKISFRRGLYELKENMKSVLLKGAGNGSGGILSAMMLGDRTDVSDDVSMDYSSAGLSHLLAISGLHVSLIGMGIMKFLKKTGMNKYAVAAVSVGFLFTYTIFTGARESTVRAFIMFTVMAVGKLILRSYDSVSSLSAAGIIILLIRPSALFRAGFQFSFAAAFGAGVLCPLITKRMNIKPLKYGRVRSVLISAAMVWISVQITTLPVMLWNYYEFPVMSIIPNMIFVPLMSIVMLMGFAGAFAGMIFPGISGIILFIPKVLTQAMADTGAFMRNIPFYSIVTGQPHPVQAAIYTAGAAMLIYALSGKKEVKKKLFPAVIAAFAFIFINLRSGLIITALDVGQGDSIVIRYDDKCFLIDSGSSSKENIASDTVLPYLKYHGVTYVDAVFITHADNDHISGVREILELRAVNRTSVNIGTVIMPRVMRNDEAAQDIINMGEKFSGGVRYVIAGEGISAGDLKFEVIYPDAEGTGDRNSDSLVMSVSFHDFRALFTGDSDEYAEKQYLSKIVHCDILKAGHHGSSGSTSQEFLDRVRPAAALISCGMNNIYGHPHQETLDRLSNAGSDIFITSESGQIDVAVNTDGSRSFRINTKK